MIFPLFSAVFVHFSDFVAYTYYFSSTDVIGYARVSTWHLPSLLLASLLLTQSLKSTITIYLNFVSLHLMKIKES